MTKTPNYFNLLPMVEMTNKHHAFAARLTDEMSKKGLSVKDLSASAGVTYEMARRYTLGTAKPRDEKLERIARLLGVQPAWLEYGREAISERPPDHIIVEEIPPVTSVATDSEFGELSEEEKRLVRVYRQFPSVEAKNMLLAFEMRYKQLYDFYKKYASNPPE
jgi:transcriptional regulator with XRE-family HTH domain